jgi:ATP-dependent Clp protease ATP-binding subunit ClpC
MNESYDLSAELKTVFKYMYEICGNEYPSEKYTIEYLFYSILNTKNCQAKLLLDGCLISSNIEELKMMCVERLEEQSFKRPRKEEDFQSNDDELENLLQNSETEKRSLGGNKLSSEHILLAILSPMNTNFLQGILNKNGLDYTTIFSKCCSNSDKGKGGKNSSKEKQMSSKKDKNLINIFGPNHSMDKNNLEKKTISLYTTNISRLFRENKLDKIIGRDKELENVVRILSRRNKNNAILVGNGGVGKTSCAYNVAQLIESENVPLVLKGKELIKLNINALVAGTNYRGMLETRLNDLFSELIKTDRYILLIDDIHNALKGGNKEKDGDLSSAIGDFLTDGTIRVIATTTPKGYRNCVESDPQIERRFQKVTVEKNTEEEAVDIMMTLKKYYEEFHSVTFSEDIIKEVVKLSDRYITNRMIPDSCVDVIDMIGANVSIGRNITEDMKNVNDEISELENIIKNSEKEGDFSTVNKTIVKKNKLQEKKKKLDSAYEDDKKKNKIAITIDDVRNVISIMTNIPIQNLSVEDKDKILNLDKVLKENVIGQDEAVDEVCKVIKRNKVGLGSKNRVRGTFLFTGESGCGKTLLAKKLAEQIYGSEKNMIRLDMSEYNERSNISKILGTSPGYVGYGEGGILTNAVSEKPYSIILLDEIEKANDEIFNLFLQVFDEGRLTDGMGKTVDFKNVIIIMTSNIGSRQAAEFGSGIGFTPNETDNRKSIIDKSLKNKFAPEFLNRIDKIIHFNHLTNDNMKNIITLELNKLSNRMKDINYNLKWDEKVVEYIQEMVLKEKGFGARPVVRIIQNEIEDGITDALLIKNYKEEYCFNASCNEDKITIT